VCRLLLTTLVACIPIVLQAGVNAPADLRLIDASGLTIDKSSLTGESVPVPCTPLINKDADSTLAEVAIILSFVSSAHCTCPIASPTTSSCSARGSLRAVVSHCRPA
jgi:magnesium-transporting ATPase (P-type)